MTVPQIRGQTSDAEIKNDRKLYAKLFELCIWF